MTIATIKIIGFAFFVGSIVFYVVYKFYKNRNTISNRGVINEIDKVEEIGTDKILQDYINYQMAVPDASVNIIPNIHGIDSNHSSINDTTNMNNNYWEN